MHSEMNVFSGMFENPIYPCVLLITVVVQTLIVFFGGAAFTVVPISGPQWLVSFIFGAGSLVVGKHYGSVDFAKLTSFRGNSSSDSSSRNKATPFCDC